MKLPLPPQLLSPLGPPLRGTDVLLVIALILAFDTVAEWAIAALIGDATPAARNNSDIAWAGLASANIMVAIWLILLRRRGFALADLGYTATVGRWAALGIALGLALVPIEYALYQELFDLFEIDQSTSWWLLPGAPHTGLLEGVTVLAYSAIIVPIAEELLFRGVIFRWLRQRFSFWPAAVASAALFGLAHVWIDSMIAAGAMGLVLAWLYERSGSLAPSILMHQTFNAAIVVAAMAIEWLGLAGT